MQYDAMEDGRRSDGSGRKAFRTLQRYKATLALAVLVIVGLLVALFAVSMGRSSPELPAGPSSLNRACPNSKVTVVRDVQTLTADERAAIVAGIHKMKTVPSKFDSNFNAWDYFVDLHKSATLPETQIHAGWWFYPWHRAMVWRFVGELRRVSGNDTLYFPYWNWADDGSTDSMMQLDYFGPRTGLVQDAYALKEGNFREGEWKIDPRLTHLDGEKETLSLYRAQGNGVQMCFDASNRSYVLDTPYNHIDVDQRYLAGPFQNLPDAAPPGSDPSFPSLYLQPATDNIKCGWRDLKCDRFYHTPEQPSQNVLRCRHFSVQHPTQDDYNRCAHLQYTTDDKSKLGLVDAKNPFATTKDYYVKYLKYFRSCFEGIDPDDVIAKGLERIGASLHPPHGATHTWMGGSLATPTSPNDPIFTHLHSNVDRMFAEWQLANGNKWFTDGPLSDQMDADIPLLKNPTVKLRDLMDTVKMGFTYDTLCATS